MAHRTVHFTVTPSRSTLPILRQAVNYGAVTAVQVGERRRLVYHPDNERYRMRGADSYDQTISLFEKNAHRLLLFVDHFLVRVPRGRYSSLTLLNALYTKFPIDVRCRYDGEEVARDDVRRSAGYIVGASGVSRGAFIGVGAGLALTIGGLNGQMIVAPPALCMQLHGGNTLYRVRRAFAAQ